MLCVGEAMSKTGLAKAIAFGVVDNIGPLGCLVAISGLYLICSILTEMISNNAVAAVMGPLAYEMALQFDANPIPFILAVMFGASASFSTPIGYQTNTYVYNAGGYKFKDFVKVGLPLNLLLWVILPAPSAGCIRSSRAIIALEGPVNGKETKHPVKGAIIPTGTKNNIPVSSKSRALLLHYPSP